MLKYVLNEKTSGQDFWNTNGGGGYFSHDPAENNKKVLTLQKTIDYSKFVNLLQTPNCLVGVNWPRRKRFFTKFSNKQEESKPNTRCALCFALFSATLSWVDVVYHINVNCFRDKESCYCSPPGKAEILWFSFQKNFFFINTRFLPVTLQLTFAEFNDNNLISLRFTL